MWYIPCRATHTAPISLFLDLFIGAAGKPTLFPNLLCLSNLDLFAQSTPFHSQRLQLNIDMPVVICVYKTFCIPKDGYEWWFCALLKDVSIFFSWLLSFSHREWRFGRNHSKGNIHLWHLSVWGRVRWRCRGCLVQKHTYIFIWLGKYDFFECDYPSRSPSKDNLGEQNVLFLLY